MHSSLISHLVGMDKAQLTYECNNVYNCYQSGEMNCTFYLMVYLLLTEKRKELEQTLESVKNWETTQRLQKVLDEKKKKQAREAERLRQEVKSVNQSCCFINVSH